MSTAVVIRGRFVNQTFFPDEPPPQVEGPAELTVTPAPAPTGNRGSIFDHVGKVPVLRSREDIEAQLKEEKDSWGEP
ncbi:MAG: hypothetical protein ACRC7O_01390 [Fimbriiglobus sp.]